MIQKMLKKATCFALALSAFASVGVFTACETQNPEVEMQIEFKNVTYTLEYKLYRKITPATVKHFLALVENGYYDGLCVHDYQDGVSMSTGSYAYSESSENTLSYKPYYDVVKKYENFPCSVWLDKAKTNPTYTLYGEFETNDFFVTSGALEQSFGALTMQYTTKDINDKIVIQRAKDGEMDYRSYKYNSATSMFSISLADQGVSSDYCTFATLDEDSVEELQELLEAIQDVIETSEYTVNVDGDDAFVADDNNTATYTVPNTPIIIKSMKVKKY